MPLHRFDQHRQQRTQPLAAHPVRRLPDYYQRLAHRLVVDATLRPRTAPIAHPPTPHEPSHVLAVEPRQQRDLVQDPATLVPIGLRVSPAGCRHQLVTRRHAQPPHLQPPS
jgi:hypothetical protein